MALLLSGALMRENAWRAPLCLTGILPSMALPPAATFFTFGMCAVTGMRARRAGRTSSSISPIASRICDRLSLN